MIDLFFDIYLIIWFSVTIYLWFRFYIDKEYHLDAKLICAAFAIPVGSMWPILALIYLNKVLGSL